MGRIGPRNTIPEIAVRRVAHRLGYRFRGAQISTPYNIDEVDPGGARFRQTSHDDAGFVGQVSELMT